MDLSVLDPLLVPFGLSLTNSVLIPEGLGANIKLNPVVLARSKHPKVATSPALPLALTVFPKARELQVYNSSMIRQESTAPSKRAPILGPTP